MTTISTTMPSRGLKQNSSRAPGRRPASSQADIGADALCFARQLGDFLSLTCQHANLISDIPKAASEHIFGSRAERLPSGLSRTAVLRQLSGAFERVRRDGWPVMAHLDFHGFERGVSELGPAARFTPDLNLLLPIYDTAGSLSSLLVVSPRVIAGSPAPRVSTVLTRAQVVRDRRGYLPMIDDLCRAAESGRFGRLHETAAALLRRFFLLPRATPLPACADALDFNNPHL